MKVRLRSLATQLTYVPRTLRLVSAAAPWWTPAWAILLVLQGLLPAATVYLTRSLVDSLVSILGTGGGWDRFRPTLTLAVMMAGVMLLSQALQSVLDYVRVVQAELVSDHLSGLIHEKSTTVDLAFYESPAYYDHLYRARYDLQERPLALLQNSGTLLQSGITLLAMATILLPYGWWLPLVLLVSTLPALLVVLRYDRYHHRWWEETTADRRKAQYYDAVMTVASVAAEVRLFGLGPHFQSAYQSVRRRLRSDRMELTRERGLARLGAGLVATLVSGVAMGWTAWRAVQGLATLGDLALFYQAFNRGQGLLRTLLGNLGQVYDDTRYLANLFEFLELEPQVGDPLQPVPAPAALENGISFRQVTFRYPGSERAVLQDFNFTIPAGKVTAIVGANGAGKTTLVKLLCRFYDPEAGCIELDGHDIRDFSLGQLQRMITALFQFPAPYIATAAENIAMGDMEATPNATSIEAAARSAGAHEFIVCLPQGYSTVLGKWFADGVELSGGEWQRLALARAFFRQAQIMILDEPTSSLDSWAEIDWFDRFRELADGRTGIIITHRLTTAKRADVIHVMDGGRIVESGSHDELLQADGLYAQSWAAQIRGSSSVPESEAARAGLMHGAASAVLITTGASPTRDRSAGPLE